MGKSNRIKATRANTSAATLGSYSKKQGMPNWAVNLIAIVVAIAILLGGILLALSANGTIMRMRTAARSEHYRVNGKMMTYYANVQYQNFLSNYESILSYFTLDTAKPLQEQTFGDTSVKENAYDTMILDEDEKEFSGTWHDYFMLQAQKEVTTMLRYCEVAYDCNVKLEAEEEKKIDDAINTIRKTATGYGYPLDAYLAASFGEGIKEKDVRRAMELSELATKGMNALSDKLISEIGDDRVLARYNDSPSEHNSVDYSFYSFRVDYSDISTEMKESNANVTDEEILAEYRIRIALAKAQAEELLATDSTEAFEEYLLGEIATEDYEAQLDKQTLPTEGKPSAEQFEAIANGVIAQSLQEFLNDEENAAAFTKKDADSDTYTGYGIEVSKEYAEIFNKVKVEVDDTLDVRYETYVLDKAEYDKNNEAFSTWAFANERSVGDTHKILNGDGAEAAGDEITRDSGYFRVDVYRLRTTQYQNKDLTRDVAYMVFSTEDEAKHAAEELASMDVNEESFAQLAADHSASSDVLENYTAGEMGVDAFDAWVFDEKTVVGSYTASPIKVSDSSYALLYYVAEGEETWFANIKDALFDEDYKEEVAAMENIEITVKDNVLAKISIGTN